MAVYNPFSWFNNWTFKPSDSIQGIAETIRAQGIQFFEVNGEVKYVSLENSGHLKDAYERCAPLSSIVGYGAKCFSDAKVQVVNANTDNEVRGQFKSWDKLMKFPNPFQNGRQFLKQLYTYTKVNGFSVVLVNWGVGMKGTGEAPASMYVLPYWLIEIKDPYKPFTQLTPDDILDNIWISDLKGDRTKLPKENILLVKDTTGVLDERFYMPISRVALNKYPISTIISSAEAEITMIQNRGAIGILSNRASDQVGSVPMRDGEKDELQKEFGKYGLSRAQRQVIITNANLEWQPMNYPTRELMLHESYAKAIKDLCDAFGVPYELMSHSDRKNLANVKTFDKILYQNTIIPDGNDISEQLTLGLGLNKLSSPLYLYFDYAHIPALQQSEQEKGQGMEALMNAYQKAWDLGIITRNQILEKMGEDTVNMEEFNQYKFEIAEQMQNDAQNNKQQGNNIGQNQQ